MTCWIVKRGYWLVFRSLLELLTEDNNQPHNVTEDNNLCHSAWALGHLLLMEVKQVNMPRPYRIAEPRNHLLSFPVTAHSQVADQYAHKSSLCNLPPTLLFFTLTRETSIDKEPAQCPGLHQPKASQWRLKRLPQPLQIPRQSIGLKVTRYSNSNLLPNFRQANWWWLNSNPQSPTSNPTQYWLQYDRAKQPSWTHWRSNSVSSNMGRGSGGKNVIFFKWPQDQFWLSKSHQIGPNMMSINFCQKKGERCPLAVSKLTFLCTNKIPNFTCYLSHICTNQSTCIWNLLSMPNCLHECLKDVY